ncbi:TonB-dependent receptor [Chryseobacterium sp. VD8]|uniref:TonB-dependent receptor n=1 Tax=Chryseobacterium sp. VD8 TaxID=3081254 RepID=UPI0030198BD6
MKKILWLLLFLFSFFMLNGQKYVIKGKITDFGKRPVENATIYLLKQKDSSLVDYTASNREGLFTIKTKELNEPTILQIDAEKLISYSTKFDTIDKSIDLGDIQLDKNQISDIEEVKITVSPIKIKKDTVEYNAKAIKVRPDSNIEELLKNIDGVEIDNNGKITVNGKEADQIMVNGKPFFDKDGKIALKNLPADIIKNIQITTTKTKEEELTGKTPKSQNKTINFNIDEKKNKGWVSKISAGYGSDKRYDEKGLINYFKDKTKISLLGYSNNINSQGVSMDDDNGKNSKLGIQKSSMIGVNYSDKLGKEVEIEELGIKRNTTNLETASKVSKTTFLPDSNLKTDSENRAENDREQYTLNSTLKIKPDTISTISFSPSFSFTKSNNFRTGNSVTFKNDELLNKSQSSTVTDSENNSFSPNLHYARKFRKKNRSFYADLITSIQQNKNNNLINSGTLFFENGVENVAKRDVRNQLSQSKNQNNNYSFNAKYTEPVSDSASVTMSMEYNSRNSVNERIVNDFDTATGKYTVYNLALSNSSDEKNNQLSPEISFNLDKKMLKMWTSLGLNLTDLNYHSTFNGQNYELQRNFALPRYNFGLIYNFSQTSNVSITNVSYFTLPSSANLIPYVDESNPLVTYKGNPDLKNSWMNSTNVYFNNYNIQKNLNYYFNFSFVYNNNNTTNYSYYDDSGKQFVTYANISGNKSVNFIAGLGKTYKWEDHKLNVRPRSGFSYSFNRGFINGQQFTGNSYNFSPGINLTYEKKDKITIKPSYSINYNFSGYQNYSIESIKNTSQNFSLELTNYFFKTNLVFENDFEYNTSSNIAPGFKRDFYFLNSSVSYTFFKKQLTARIKVYDVLNQNQSVTRTISASGVEDREDLILKRYVMFSLVMKLNKFGGKKK